MQKLLSLAAGIALVSFAGAANAADDQKAEKATDQPITLTAAQMDEVTAGRLGGTASTTRSLSLGAYSLVFDGRTWSVVWD